MFRSLCRALTPTERRQPEWWLGLRAEHAGAIADLLCGLLAGAAFWLAKHAPGRHRFQRRAWTGAILAAMPMRFIRFRQDLLYSLCSSWRISFTHRRSGTRRSCLRAFFATFGLHGLSRQAFRERAQRIAGEILMFKEGLTCTSPFSAIRR